MRICPSNLKLLFHWAFTSPPRIPPRGQGGEWRSRPTRAGAMGVAMQATTGEIPNSEHLCTAVQSLENYGEANVIESIIAERQEIW